MSKDAERAGPPPATWFDRNTPTFAARCRASRTYRFLAWTLVVLNAPRDTTVRPAT